MLVTNGFFFAPASRACRELLLSRPIAGLRSVSMVPTKSYLASIPRGETGSFGNGEKSIPVFRSRSASRIAVGCGNTTSKTVSRFPFDSKTEIAAYRVCMQKTCTQLYRSMLWKCPALAYFNQVEAKMKLHHLPQWQPFREYQACPPEASDDEVRRFLKTKAIPQCGLCPANRTMFVHPNPLQRSALR